LIVDSPCKLCVSVDLAKRQMIVEDLRTDGSDPALLVRTSGATWARIVAGTAHFWWLHGDRKQLIGPVDATKRDDIIAAIVGRFEAIRKARKNRTGGPDSRALMTVAGI
jgi:hypothetical protein